MESTSTLLNQIKQKAEIRQVKINLFKQKTDNLIKQSKPTYEQIGEVVDALPFEVSPQWKPAIAKHLVGMSYPYHFINIVLKAEQARAPERYLMRCLANKSQGR